jgi:two-component system, CAI-1 autoinducer sensor kinase/phosphatase CqsS
MPALLRSELLRLLHAPKVEPETETALPLLDGHRLAELRGLGLLHELASVCVEEIGHHCQWVKACSTAADLAGAQQALHSLLGVSGEAGALALYDLAQGFHAALLQGQWPAAPEWPARLEAIALRTQRAIREQAAAGWPAGDAGHSASM